MFLEWFLKPSRAKKIFTLNSVLMWSPTEEWNVWRWEGAELVSQPIDTNSLLFLNCVAHDLPFDVCIVLHIQTSFAQLNCGCHHLTIRRCPKCDPPFFFSSANQIRTRQLMTTLPWLFPHALHSGSKREVLWYRACFCIISFLTLIVFSTIFTRKRGTHQVMLFLNKCFVVQCWANIFTFSVVDFCSC